MQLGVNLLCATGFVDDSSLPLVELAKKEGFDGVEIPMLSGDPSHYKKLGRQLDALDIRRTCTSIIPDPKADPTSINSEIRKRGIEHLNWIVNCAVELEAEVIGGPFHAPIGHFTGKGPTLDEWKRGAEAHHEMAEIAASHGIKLALEPLNRFESHFLNTAEQAATYVDMVNHPGFGIMYDTFHGHIEEKDQSKAITSLGSTINVLHVSENDRGIPGTGQVDFKKIFSALKQTGFDDWIVLEAFGSGVPEIAAATRIWRPMFDSHEELFSQSADFIRREWSGV